MDSNLASRCAAFNYLLLYTEGNIWRSLVSLPYCYMQKGRASVEARPFSLSQRVKLIRNAQSREIGDSNPLGLTPTTAHFNW